MLTLTGSMQHSSAGVILSMFGMSLFAVLGALSEAQKTTQQFNMSQTALVDQGALSSI